MRNRRGRIGRRIVNLYERKEEENEEEEEKGECEEDSEMKMIEGG